MKNYREYMREAIKSPVDGTSSSDFGKWAILNKEQRILIGRLLDEMDGFDEAYKHLWFENKQLKDKLKQITKLIRNVIDKNLEIDIYTLFDIQDIIKDEEQEKLAFERYVKPYIGDSNE